MPIGYRQYYAATNSLAIEDARDAKNKEQFEASRLPWTMSLFYKDKPFEAQPWLAGQVVNEMTARGLPVAVAKDGIAGTKLSFKRISIETHRVNGFSPIVTFASLRAEVETPQGMQRVSAYVKRAKVPVWSFDEVYDPTFNASLDILSKEVAAKLNQQLIRQSVSDEAVKTLIEKINSNITSDTVWQDVYQLGFSNNSLAIPELVKLSGNQSEYVRLAALSSLGILKAKDQMPFLAERYESRTGIWQDRAMALKAIGDMGTMESRSYLEKQMDRFKTGEDNESRWTRDIISLYL